jgi:hypothetical protein
LRIFEKKRRNAGHVDHGLCAFFDSNLPREIAHVLRRRLRLKIRYLAQNRNCGRRADGAQPGAGLAFAEVHHFVGLRLWGK